MKLHFTSIPVFNSGEAQAELNAFVQSNRVLSVDRTLINDGAASCWAICVSYLGEQSSPAAMSKKAKIDYREVLSDVEFKLYAKLRSLRKDLSDKEGVPAYALFTNEQLATMVQKDVRTATAMAEIDGVGKSRLEKYAPAFLEILVNNAKGAAAS